MKRQVIAAVIALELALSLPSCSQERKHLPAVAGNPAPSFSLRDTDGSTVRLADYAGKMVVLDFWATWCGPCKETTREFEQLHRRYGGKGVVFIGISMDKGGAAVRKVQDFAKTHGITYRLLMDDGTASAAYAVTRVPDTYVLDRDHVILKNYPGYQKALGARIADEIEGRL